MMTKLAPIAREEETARQRPTYLFRTSVGYSAAVVRQNLLIFHHDATQRLTLSQTDMDMYVCMTMRSSAL